MIALLQRVRSAYVDVEGDRIAEIGVGVVALIGVQAADTESRAARLAERIAGYRIFADPNGKMNLSVVELRRAILLVPQFTLAADTSKGARPSFTPAAPPDEARRLFERLAAFLRGAGVEVQCGKFGADMKVGLVNDGPVTFWLEA